MATSDEIAAQTELLAKHRGTLEIYLRRLALLGEAHVTPEVAHGIDEARRNIRRIKGILAMWGVDVANAPDDEPIKPGTANITATPAEEAGSASHKNALSAGQRQRLKQMLVSMQKEWDLRAEKADRLRKAAGLETHPARALELEKYLLDEEAALAQLGDRMREIEQQVE